MARRVSQLSVSEMTDLVKRYMRDTPPDTAAKFVTELKTIIRSYDNEKGK